MSRKFRTALSTHDESSITVRDKSLTDEVMDTMDFTGALYYLWTGTEPTPAQHRIVDAVLVSLMVHGTTPSAIASRMTYMTEPNAIQGSIAAGIIGVGSQFIGTMKECAEELNSIAEANDHEEEITALVTDYLDRGAPFAGIGHPHLDPVDPRAELLFRIASEEDISTTHIDILQQIRDEFEHQTGASLPINATGAIAAVTADIGLSPRAARSLAVISRAAGVAGEVLEEHEQPIAPQIWEYVDSNTTPPGDA